MYCNGHSFQFDTIQEEFSGEGGKKGDVKPIYARCTDEQVGKQIKW